MEDRAARLSRIARGWDEAADGYEAYFVPRFAPWVRAAVSALGDLPDGPVLVPCCGTFPELDLLPRKREIVGIDLSAGMVHLARQRAQGRPEVTVLQGDATTLDPQWRKECAAVISVFGLQQLPDPVQAIGSWTEALTSAGWLSVVYWPAITETDGPFALMSSLLPGPGSYDWEDGLAAAIAEHGGVIERDEMLSFPMSHVDAVSYFEAYAQSGPLRGLALARGEEFVAELREQFLAAAPAGEWQHTPRARILVARSAERDAVEPR